MSVTFKQREREMKSRYLRRESNVTYTPNMDTITRCVTTAALHARRVCLRMGHLNCQQERAWQFVTSLRRELRQAGQAGQIVVDLCHSGAWDDAGVPSASGWYRDRLKPYFPAIEVGMQVADSRTSAIENDLEGLAGIVNVTNKTIEKTKQINQDADKLLEELKQLTNNMEGSAA